MMTNDGLSSSVPFLGGMFSTLLLVILFQGAMGRGEGLAKGYKIELVLGHYQAFPLL